MRVALVCPYAWDRPGGVQSHIRALSRALQRRDHETLVIAPTVDRAEIAEEGVERLGHAIGIPANGSVAPIAFGPIAAARLRRAISSFDPDVLHVHEPLIPSLSLLAVWNASQRPIVGTFHAAAESSTGYRAARAVLERAVRKLTIRTAVSDAARSLVSRYFPGEYVITPNGVEVERFARAEPLDLDPHPIVLFLSRIEKRKGLSTLIEAVARLGDLDVHLVVAGEGPEAADAAKLASKLDVRATFLGRLGEDEVPRAYRTADVYCAPGLGGESFGIVLVEAMAAGVPVVCSNLPGFAGVVGGAAALVPPGDEQALAEAIRSALGADGPEWRKRSIERAHAFEWDGLAAGVEGLYRRARRLQTSN